MKIGPIELELLFQKILNVFPKCEKLILDRKKPEIKIKKVVGEFRIKIG